jgi:hypothetical protein
MSPPAKTCRTCAWYRRESISRDLPTHGACMEPSLPLRPTHANSRPCARWMLTLSGSCPPQGAEAPR